LADPALSDELEFSVVTSLPTSRQQQLALAIVALIITSFLVTTPFATIQLLRLDSFVPATAAVIFATDLTTAVLLFSQFSIIRSSALLVLASGYLFSALIVIPHALTFPGAFAPTGLLAAGIQSAPWLFTFWHFGFPIAVVGYAFLADARLSTNGIRTSAVPAVFWSAMIVIGLVCALTWGVTAGERLMPRLFLDEIGFAPLANYVTTINFCICILALVLLWKRRRSILDLWLMVTVWTLMTELAMVSFFVTHRFSLGFYSVRGLSLAVAAIVLIVLLSETVRMDARLSRANSMLRRERESKLMSLEAVVATIAHEVKQPLTAIATKGAAARRFLGGAPPNIERADQLLADMTRAAFRADEIFESIRSLFRDADQGPIDTNGLILEALQVLRDELQFHNIKFSTQLTSELPLIVGHKGQLQEVIINLIQNAIDAMKTMNYGIRDLKLATAHDSPDAISISVEDSGPGINSKRLGSIFDAFVTTKVKGMGLGLAICRIIIERHDGQLSVSSDINRGARFQISLPIRAAAH
jgi:signal transduction histidine kinase